MATHIKLTLDTRRKDTKIFPIIFRMTHNRKTTSIATGHSIAPNYWDEKNQKIKATYKGTENPARLNNSILKRKAHMIDMLTKLEDKGKLKYMSVSEVRSCITNTSNEVTFFHYTEMLIEQMKEARRIGNARVYDHTLRAVKSFRKNRDFSFDELNLEFLNHFEINHLAKGNKLGGLSVYLRTIRAINRKAIKAGVADEEGYAFKDYIIKNGKPEKRALTIESIKKIFSLELDKKTALFRDRSIFMMSFFLNGMSYTDLVHLKLSNIVDGRIKYVRQKTDEQYNIQIQEQLHPILKHFTEGKQKTDYVLNVIKDKDPILQYKNVVNARKRFNKNLKKIAELVGIEETLTSYVSRHSFASVADDMGIPLTGISQMLGHKKFSTTQAYLSNLRNSKIDEYQNTVIGKL